MNIDNLIRQTKRYEFSDGLRDLQLALVFLFIGLLAWGIFQPGWLAALLELRDRLGVGGMWAILLLALAIPVLAVWLSPKLLRAVRQHWTWRESGMIQSRRIVVPRRVTLVAALLTVGIIILAALWRGWGQGTDLVLWRMIWLAAGWGTGYTLIGIGREIDLPRYIVLGIVGSALSTIALFLATAFPQVGLFFGLSWGMVFAISGAIALSQSQRHAHDV